MVFRMLYDFYTQSYPPAPKWSASSIPDQAGKVVFVTGANTGIGYETVKALAAKNAKVYLTCRNEQKGKDAMEKLGKELDAACAKRVEMLVLDLADLESVKRAVEEFKSKESRLDILYNNGGLFWTKPEQLTAQGYDYVIGINVLGHFYLTKLLLPLLTESAKTAPGGQVRVITVASIAHRFAKLDASYLKDSEARLKMAKGKLGLKPFYDQSKLMNIQVSREFARRHGEEGVAFIALNPGNINTGLGLPITDEGLKKWTYRICIHSPEKGALTQLYAGTAPETAGMNGEYFIPWARKGPISKRARNQKEASEVWDMLEEIVKDV